MRCTNVWNRDDDLVSGHGGGGFEGFEMREGGDGIVEPEGLIGGWSLSKTL